MGALGRVRSNLSGLLNQPVFASCILLTFLGACDFAQTVIPTSTDPAQKNSNNPQSPFVTPTIKSFNLASFNNGTAIFTYELSSAQPVALAYGTPSSFDTFVIPDGAPSATGRFKVASLLANRSYGAMLTMTYINEAGASVKVNAQPLAFTSAATPPSAPEISQISVSPITATTAMVTYKTDVFTKRTVEFGTTSDLKNGGAFNDTTATTDHSATISLLNAATTYYFRITATNTAAGSTVSAVKTFKTATAPVTTGFVPLFDGLTLNGWLGADATFWRVENGELVGQRTANYTDTSKYHTLYLVSTHAAANAKNFDLKFRCKLTKGGDSGISYRGVFSTTGALTILSGYQIDFATRAGRRDSDVAWFKQQGLSVDAPALGATNELWNFPKNGPWQHYAQLYDETPGAREHLCFGGRKVVRTSTSATVRNSDDASVEALAMVGTIPDHYDDYEVIAQGQHLVHKINGKVVVDFTDNDVAAKRHDNVGKIGLQLHEGLVMTVRCTDISIKVLP